MRRLTLVLIMATIVLVAGTGWAGKETIITCDQCGEKMVPDDLCNRYSYYVLHRVDLEFGPLSCTDYNPPLHKIFCSLDCLREWMKQKEEPEFLEIDGADYITIPAIDANTTLEYRDSGTIKWSYPEEKGATK